MPVKIPQSHLHLFKEPVIANLATLMADGQPQVNPVWCDYDGTYVRVNSAKGRAKDKNMRRRHNRHLGLAAWIWIFATIPCWADELSSQPLEVRLWSAMSRSISSTDAIGRQASVAYPSGSSENPAAIDVRDFELIDTRGYICMGTHHVVFSEDAWFAAGDINGFVHLNKAGTISVGYIRIATPEGSTRQGFDDDFRNNDFSMKYGRQIHKKGYVGFGVRVRDMELDYGDLFQGFPRDTQNHSIGGSFTLGGLWRPNPEWTLGALIDTGNLL